MISTNYKNHVQLILHLDISSIIFFKIQHLQNFVSAYPKNGLYKEQAIGPDVMYKIICETRHTSILLNSITPI